MSQEVRPGKVAIRGTIFRRKTDYKLLGEAVSASPGEERLEQFHYQHGELIVEGQKVGKGNAEKLLAGERVSKRTVAFQTNVLDCGPRCVFRREPHPERPR